MLASTAVFVAVAAVLLMGYAEAVSDGIEWKLASDMDIIAPTFVEQNPQSASRVPDFSLKDRFGNDVRLSQFDAVDLLLVNLWSSGCPPCQREIPALSEMDRRLTGIGKVALLTITIDEKWEDVVSYFPQGSDLRVLFDPEQKVVKGIFKTEKFPETFILDKSRKIRARFDGERNWHSQVMLDYIRRFVSE